MHHRPIADTILCLIVGALGVYAVIDFVRADEPPAPGVTVRGVCTEVYDGDTITVEVTTRMRVRIIDLWCAELRDEGGPEARDRMAELVEGKAVTVQVPSGRRLGDSFSFGRALGHVWVGETDVAGVMVEEGFGTREKP